MSDDAEQIARWVEAFKETQRQMSHAHETYQRALAESHQKYLRAVGESQDRLVSVLERYGVDPDATVLQTLGSDENTARFLRGRSHDQGESMWVHSIIKSCPLPGQPFSSLRDGATICVIPDALGLAGHVVELLNIRGYWASISEVPVAADMILVLAGLQKDPGATRSALDTAMHAVFDVEHGGVVLVQDTGGEFMTEALMPSNTYQNGMMGLAELAQKVSMHKIKVLDLDVGFRKIEEVADSLINELVLGGDDPFVALPEGGRFLWSQMEHKKDAETIEFDPGVLLVTASVGSWDALIDFLGQSWKGKVVVIGEETTANVDRIPCDVTDSEALYQALEVAREQGVFRRWIHLPSCQGPTHGSQPLANLWKSDVVPFHVVMAATAADPLRQIAILNPTPDGVGHITASVLRAIALAENARRGQETHVMALTVDPNLEPSEIADWLSCEEELSDLRRIART